MIKLKRRKKEKIKDKNKIKKARINLKKPIEVIGRPVKSIGKISGRIYDSIFLRNQQRKLGKELKRLAKELEKVKKFPDYGSAEDDSAREVQQFVGNLGLRKNFQQLYKDTETALEKIKKGTYGKCEECKVDIESARLKVFPSASLCIKCASKRIQRVRISI